MKILEEYMQISLNYLDEYYKNNEAIKDVVSSFELFEFISYDSDIVLRALNVSPKRCGYKYWKDAIFLYIVYNKTKISICNEIYPNIARKYNKTARAIERAMRLCFEDVMYYISKMPNNFIGEYLKSSLLYPHNGEILAKLVSLIVSKNFQKNKDSYFNI